MGASPEPVLCISKALLTRQEEYYASFANVRENGAYEAWVEFFLEAAGNAAAVSRDILRGLQDLYAKNREALATCANMQDKTLRLFHLLHVHPVITQDAACRELGSSPETLGTCVENLRTLGILQECGKYLVYRNYLDTVSA